MKKEKVKKIFFISTESSYEYAHVRISILRINEHGKPRNFSSDVHWDTKKTEYYNNLQVRNQIGQISSDESVSKNPCKSYGWEWRYRNVYSVNRSKAEAMFKTLKWIGKKMEKVTEDRSYPSSFGEFVGRISEVLKITEFWFYKDETHNSSYDENEYIVKNRQDGIDAINHLSLKLYEELPVNKNKAA